MPPVYRARIALSLAVAIVAIGCQKKPWSPKNYTSSEALFVAAKERLDRGRLDEAIAGFEQLTLDLPARDTLLSRSHFWLGIAHERKREYILAAQSFTRLTESFPDDSLADDALVRAGRAYHRLWRKSYLDATYGESALSTFNTMLSLYPNSDLRGEAQAEVDRIEAQFAKKDYDTGVHYLKRKAYDPAIIYFSDVVEKYPRTDWARRARLRLVESYTAINYRAERDEICTALRERFPGDGEVRERCGTAPAAATRSPAVPATAPDSQSTSSPPAGAQPAPPAPAH